MHPQVLPFRGGFRRGRHHSYNTFHNVVYVGEVAAAVAVVIDLDGLAAKELVGEAEIGHVGTAGRAVDGEEAQAGGGDVVELGVAVGKELVALLGGGIEADGVVYTVVGRERHFLVAAIDAAAAGVDEVFHRIVAACLEDVVEADDVALDIHVGILDAIADTGLCGEVHHDVETVLGKEAVDQLLVGDASSDKEVVALDIVLLATLVEHAQAVLLEGDIVVVVEVVETYDVQGLTALQQPQHQIGSYEPGGAGD